MLKCTHLTPFTAPPLSVHKREPSWLIARETGNSPPEEIGLPINSMFVGWDASIENREMVFEPAY